MLTPFITSRFKLYAKIIVSVSLIVFLFSRVNVSLMLERIAIVRWVPLVGVFLLVHADRLLMALKWRFLVASSGLFISRFDALVTTYMGNFAGQLLPSGIGSDFVRVYLLRKLGNNTVEVSSSILVERIFGLLALLATAVLSLFMGHFLSIYLPPKLERVVLYIFLGLSTTVLISFLLQVERVLERFPSLAEKSMFLIKLGQIIESYRKYSKRKGVIITFLFLSISEVIVMATIFYMGCSALRINLSFIALLMVMPIVLMLQRVPISINAIGVQEGLLGYFFTLLGQSLESAILLSIMLRLIEIIALLPGGYWYFTWGKEAQV